MAIDLNYKYDPRERYRAVVEHGRGTLVVSAGPGTGKTWSLLRKIESLLNLGVDPETIYYLTFVKSIVDAFEKDISAPTDKGGLGKTREALGIKVSTLHSLAFRIVSTYSDDLCLPSHLELIDLGSRADSLLATCFFEDIYAVAVSQAVSSGKKQFKRMLSGIVSSWRNNCEPALESRSVVDLISTFKKRFHVWPWDSLVPLANGAIRDHGLPKWLQAARQFLIDEYQDFNPAEQELIKRITEPSDSVVIVGDPDQSIYSGRDASPDGLEELLQDASVYSVNFTVCRRCPRAIVDAANGLLKYMDPLGYDRKMMKYFKQEPGVAKIRETISCKAEIELIVEVVRKLQEAGHDDIILLFPTKKALEFYRGKLTDVGLQCDIRSSTNDRELLEACLRLAALRSHPYLERIVLSCFGSLERWYRRYVLSEFINLESDLLPAMKEAHSKHKMTKVISDQLDIYDRVIGNLVSGTVEGVARAMKDLKLDISPNVLQCVLEFDSDGSVREHVLACLDEITENNGEEEKQCDVSLLTIHSAKGLTKNTVVIPAFEDRWLPGPKSGASLAEQHRLIYVAVTRAEKHVLFTFPRTRARADPLNFLPPNAVRGLSRYAAAMGLKPYKT